MEWRYSRSTLLVLDNGYITVGREDDNRAAGSASVESLPLPLRTAVWTYRTFGKNSGKQQPDTLENLIR